MSKEHVCDVRATLGWYEPIPAQGGGWTNFYLLGCPKCRKVIGFPEYNFGIVTPEARAKIVKEIAGGGWKIEES